MTDLAPHVGNVHKFRPYAGESEWYPALITWVSPSGHKAVAEVRFMYGPAKTVTLTRRRSGRYLERGKDWAFLSERPLDAVAEGLS